MLPEAFAGGVGGKAGLGRRKEQVRPLPRLPSPPPPPQEHQPYPDLHKPISDFKTESLAELCEGLIFAIASKRTLCFDTPKRPDRIKIVLRSAPAGTEMNGCL